MMKTEVTKVASFGGNGDKSNDSTLPIRCNIYLSTVVSLIL